MVPAQANRSVPNSVVTLSFERPNAGALQTLLPTATPNHLTALEIWLLTWLENIGDSAGMSSDLDFHCAMSISPDIAESYSRRRYAVEMMAPLTSPVREPLPRMIFLTVLPHLKIDDSVSSADRCDLSKWSRRGSHYIAHPPYGVRH
jgi:hypothetical protein